MNDTLQKCSVQKKNNNLVCNKIDLGHVSQGTEL